MRRFERHQDIEAFLTEIAGTLATKGMPGYAAARELLFGKATTRLSLEHCWVTHLERMGAWLIRIGYTRTYVDARSVHILGVRSGHLAAAHGKARVEIEVEPPVSDERVEAVRAELEERAREGRTALRDALCDGMATRSDVLLPAARTIRARCTCSKSAAACKHVLAVLVAFGTRLDAEPELLVRLRGLEALDVSPGPLPTDKQGLTGDLAAIFGIDLEAIELAGSDDETAANAPADDAEPMRIPPSAQEEVGCSHLQVLEPAEVEHPRIPPSEQEEVGREYLQVLGLQSRTIDAWLRGGVLRRTERRDVYLRTPEANRRIARYLAC